MYFYIYLLQSHPNSQASRLILLKLIMLHKSIVTLKCSIFFVIVLFVVNIGFAQDAKRVLLNSNINLLDIDELNPQLTPDGKTLYFSRTNYVGNIGGKQAGQDIYTSTKDDNGVWQASKNIEKPLNNFENNALGGFSRNLSKAYVANVYGNNASQGISVANFELVLLQLKNSTDISIRR